MLKDGKLRYLALRTAPPDATQTQLALGPMMKSLVPGTHAKRLVPSEVILQALLKKEVVLTVPPDYILAPKQLLCPPRKPVVRTMNRTSLLFRTKMTRQLLGIARSPPSAVIALLRTLRQVVS